MSNKNNYALIKSIIMHLVPGIIITFAYFLFVPIVKHFEFPYDLALLISVLLVLVPIEFGILLYVTKKQTNTFNIKTQIPYLEKSSLKEYLMFIPIMAIYALLVSNLLNPIELTIRDNIFAFIPSESIMISYDTTIFTKEKLLLTAILSVLINGFIAPITEEIYFRGYLLPLVNLSPLKATVLNAVLFSLYHFYSPWHFFSRVIMMIPLYYWVVKKKNIRFSIIAHVVANLFTSLSFLISIL